MKALCSRKYKPNRKCMFCTLLVLIIISLMLMLSADNTEFERNLLVFNDRNDVRTKRLKKSDDQSEASKELSGAQKSSITKSKNGNRTKSFALGNKSVKEAKPETGLTESIMSKSNSTRTKLPTSLKLITELTSDPNAPGEFGRGVTIDSTNLTGEAAIRYKKELN
ncbi:hypothetical protein EB796_012164 [Bugula neritina]|uniref:Uncharacterized protein n=1 Tax=Bugula neritina TaxID=10212 RepID=A0A7J7JU48_BUGNE|nr:hypothetical protein EB796_012164 [Bugula neritina]